MARKEKPLFIGQQVLVVNKESGQQLWSPVMRTQDQATRWADAVKPDEVDYRAFFSVSPVLSNEGQKRRWLNQALGLGLITPDLRTHELGHALGHKKPARILIGQSPDGERLAVYSTATNERLRSTGCSGSMWSEIQAALGPLKRGGELSGQDSEVLNGLAKEWQSRGRSMKWHQQLAIKTKA